MNYFSQLFACKRPKINEKEARDGPFLFEKGSVSFKEQKIIVQSEWRLRPPTASSYFVPSESNSFDGLSVARQQQQQHKQQQRKARP